MEKIAGFQKKIPAGHTSPRQDSDFYLKLNTFLRYFAIYNCVTTVLRAINNNTLLSHIPRQIRNPYHNPATLIGWIHYTCLITPFHSF